MNRRQLLRYLEENGFVFVRDTSGGEMWQDRDHKQVCVSRSLRGRGIKNFLSDVKRIIKARNKAAPIQPPPPKPAPRMIPTIDFSPWSPPPPPPRVRAPEPEPTPEPVPEPVMPPIVAEESLKTIPTLPPKPATYTGVVLKNPEQKTLYDTEVKKRSRKELRKFIKKYLLKHRVRVDELMVLCLPGAEALEIFQIYDKLGVPRKNIVCIEFIKLFHDQIAAMNLGVELHHMTVKDYLEKFPNKKFHVISLDFMGHLYTNIDDFRALTKHKHMHDECVVFTNFCAAREKAAAKALLLQHTPSPNEAIHDLDAMRNSITPIIKKELEGNGSINYFDVVAIEELSLQRLKQAEIERVEEHIRELERLEQTEDNVKKVELYKLMVEDFANSDNLNNHLVEYMHDHMEHKISTLFRLKFDVTTLQIPTKGIKIQSYSKEGGQQLVPCADEFYEQQTFYSYKEGEAKPHVVDRATFVPVEGAVGVLRLAAEDYFFGEHHRVHEIKSCRYVGYSRIPMFCDMFYLKKEKDWNTLKGYLNDHGETIASIFFPLFDKKKAREIADIVDKCKNVIFSRTPARIPEQRDNLGNESHINPRPEGDYSEEYDLEIMEAEITGGPARELPVSLDVKPTDGSDDDDGTHHFKTEDVIRKARAMVLANPEMTSYQIAEKTGAKIMTVAALIAHRTRGTYDGVDPDEYGETG